MKWHRERERERERRRNGERPKRDRKSRVQETRVESKWRRGESRVNRTENATVVRAGKDRGKEGEGG
ncbi:hypothetical protein ALC57_10261 [Trachymyrmex cornetzi]|uniref:Uncharacterized protein n=1 Tax=Trachymyrmex cornetzi TaxID=471704 RepID=A0A195DXX7_9HYME|nr:hypothetical protein ALC57_10261 [Trachymyrmex cornetzi]